MKKKIVWILVTIIVSGLVGIGSYFLTEKIDKLRKDGNVLVTVTFDDTKEFELENVKKLEEKEALLEWPYIFEVKNDGDMKGIYQIIITDLETSTIKRDRLNYVLLLDDVKLASGRLLDIKENILYTNEIEGGKTQKYKLYIWNTTDNEKDDKYAYQLKFNTIKAGGPGF